MLVTVEQAAKTLKLHPRTVLRHIRSGRLPATRIGKSYRIDRSKLDALTGATSDRADAAENVRATCIVELPDQTLEDAEQLASFLNAAALTRDEKTQRLHLSTAFDPLSSRLKIVVIGSPSDAATLLGMLQLKLGGRA